MPKPLNRQSESLKRAIELAAVDWDNVICLASRFDITTNSTMCGVLAHGNSYALEAQVKEWVREMDEGDICCGPDCECRMDEEDDPADDEDRDGDDAMGNR